MVYVAEVLSRELQIEEGDFWKGVTFIPGWFHDPKTHQPIKRLFQFNLETRALELEKLSLVKLTITTEDIDKHEETLLKINKMRSEMYGNLV